MKIAHVQHPYLPGFGYQENYLPAYQEDMGHEVIIFTSTLIPPKFKEGFDANSFPPGEYKYKGVETHRLQSWFEIKTIGDVLLQDLQLELNRFEPDVIHAHGLVSPRTFQAWRYARSQDTKLFIDVHIDNGNFSIDSVHKRVVFNIFNNIILPELSSQTTSFLTVNGYALEFLEEKTTIPKHQIAFLPLGVDRDLFSPTAKIESQVRDDLGVSQNEILLIFAGNIEPSKDMEVLLKSLATISAEYSLLLLGTIEDDYKNDLIQLAQNLGISSNVILHDAVSHEELSKYLNSADVGVWPGKLGITAIEAIGTGLPLIVSDDEAMGYLVSNENGLSFPKGDEKSLANKIQMYLKDRKLLDTHSQNAAQFARDELYWDNIAEKSIRIYNE
jgi:glycosyltransferase involved in cell wall biosynthesis